MMTKLLIPFLFPLSLLFGVQDAPLKNSKWKLLSVKDSLMNKTFDFSKSGSSLAVNDSMFCVLGCNGISSKYNLGEGNKITIAYVNTTAINCPGDYEKIETYVGGYFFNLVYHIRLDTLTLYNGSKGITFKYLLNK